MLTSAQMATVKADILANNDLNSQPNNQDGAFEIARLYNLIASPDFLVWRTEAPTADIFDAITWANFTPDDAADNTVTFTNRAMLIQTKQMNLQNMLIGRGAIDASKVNVRTGLRDAVIALPSGTGGAAKTAGGASGITVMTACVRKATRLEKLLATSAPALGGVTASIMGFEGSVSYDEINQARNS